MIFQIVLYVWEFMMDIASITGMGVDEKDLEILLLRQQLRIVERKHERGPQILRWQKVPLAMLAMRLKKQGRHGKVALEESVRLFKPATVIGWHRAMVRRKWTYKQGTRPGRPPIDKELEQLIVQVARDNPDLGYEKLTGEDG
jgi:putative transposase